MQSDKPSNGSDRLTEIQYKTGRPTEAIEAFFAERRKLGLGVGLDENGNLIYGENAAGKKATTPKDG